MSDPDAIRILIATDSHVGYNERDPIRGDDSWKSFHEVLTHAKEQDVDMVLLSGDLFHENKPSRKAMYQVMKTLRETCMGDKPCELEILSDTSSEFFSAGGKVNYEDENINVAIPVFSIHGNHDDPSGEGRLCALDLLAVAGLVNYFGRTPENDNITITPVLLQKGSTKLALYGMSNVRDERLFRTFRDGKVKFLRPEVQSDEWFNLMTVHQNHHGHTETGYLPENFLQSFLDVVIWGHEHECLIEPRINPEMGFSVIQPGSSIATSLCEGEAVPKHCAILTINPDKTFTVDPIRLRTVRPFIMREIVLADEPEMKNVWKKRDNRTKITEHLTMIVNELIEEARKEWLDAQDSEDGYTEADSPLPLVRLRVEYSSPEGSFEVENPQRFSNRFIDKVANVNDVVQFYRKKTGIVRGKSGSTLNLTETDSKIIAEYGGNIDSIKVENLVKEFLDKATLEILPTNGLGDAVGQFVQKDDRHAVETFVDESLKQYLKKLKEIEEELNEDNIGDAIEKHKSHLEEMFEKGQVKIKKRKALKPKPDGWDSDIDGAWEDQPAAQIIEGEDVNDSEPDSPAPAATGRGRGRGRGRGTTTTSRTSTAKKTPAGRGRGRGKAKPPSDNEDSDSFIVPDDEEEDETPAGRFGNGDGDDDDDIEMIEAPPPLKKRAAPATKKAAPAKAPATKRVPAKKAAATPAPSQRQSQLNFQPVTRGTRGAVGGSAKKPPVKTYTIPSDDDDVEEISDDEEDDFVPAASQKVGRRR